MHFIELIIRDEGTVLHKEVAQVPDNFAEELLDAYRVYYPDAKGETALYQRISRGIFEGLMANIAASKNVLPEPPPTPEPPMQFTLESEQQPEPEPPPPPGA